MRLLPLFALCGLVGCTTAPRVVAVPVTGEGSAPEEATYTVTGTVTMSAIPDVAELAVVLTSERVKPRDAAAAVRRDQEALLQGLDQLGFARSDVALSRMTLAPVHETVDRLGKTRVRGYAASTTVTLTTRDFEQLPDLMELVATSGATVVSTAFRVDDLPGLKRRAWEQAAKVARGKAEAMADVLGFELGPVRGVVERDGDGYGANFVANHWKGEVPADLDAVSVEAQELTVSVSVTYAL